ncbi:MAG: AbrB/MazE/SpoVT family DNA-binding domain-containing protein [Nitrososphaerota archaeon]
MGEGESLLSRSGWLVPVALLLLLSLTLHQVDAITYNSLIDDGKLSITFNYPSEVKRGTCFNVRVEANALVAVTDLNVTVSIELRSGPSVYVLFSGKVVDDWSGGPGPVTNNVVGACVSSSHPVGIVILRTSIEYDLGSDRLTLDNSFLMASVRDTTYDELAALYSAAQSEISRLRAAMGEMGREIDRLRAQVSDLMSQVSVLSDRLEQMRTRYDELQSAYNALLAQFRDLQDRYVRLQQEHERLSRDYAALQARESDLRGAYAGLQKELDALRSEYAELQKRHAALNALHDDLRKRFEELNSAYQDAVRQIGSLSGALEERGRQMEVLTAMLDNALRERNVFSNIVIAQALGLGGLGALYMIERRRLRRPGSSQAAPGVEAPEGGSGAPPTPSPELANIGPDENRQDNGNGGMVQRVISGRRITIPKKVAELLGIEVGDPVELGVVGDAIFVRKLARRGDGPPPSEPDGPSRRS